MAMDIPSLGHPRFDPNFFSLVDALLQALAFAIAVRFPRSSTYRAALVVLIHIHPGQNLQDKTL